MTQEKSPDGLDQTVPQESHDSSTPISPEEITSPESFHTWREQNNLVQTRLKKLPENHLTLEYLEDRDRVLGKKPKL